MGSQNMQNMRTPLARALGLGSAKKGAAAWWAERVSAVALVPLTLWFAASVIAHTGSDHAAFIAWLSTPLAAILMVLLLIALFYHTALGLEVVIVCRQNNWDSCGPSLREHWPHLLVDVKRRSFGEASVFE